MISRSSFFIGIICSLCLLIFHSNANAQPITFVDDNIIGITYSNINDSIVLGSVKKGWPGYYGGLIEGDIILKINNTQCSGNNIKPSELNSLFSLTDENSLNLIVLRDNVPQPIEIIVSMDYFREYDRSEKFFIGILFGIFIIAGIYFLTISLFLGETNYFYYSLLVFGICMVMLNDTGYGDELFWPGRRMVSGYFTNSVLIYIPFLFYYIFGIRFLELRTRFKSWYLLFSGMSVFLGVLIILSFISGSVFPFNKDSGRFLLNLLAAGSILVFFILLVIPTLISIKNKYTYGWFFLTSHIILALILIYQLIFPSSIYDSNLLSMLSANSLYLGFSIQIFALAIGMGNKMKIGERRVTIAQKRLINQLRANEKLKDKVNRELEIKVKERTKEIEAKQKEITDSINYARRIQTAVLPTPELMNDTLPEHFVLFKPCEIVSGDFYWIRQLKNFTIVAVADCTGHGVPGAFMSMLGISFLNEIVTRSRFDSAGEMLDRLREKVKNTLCQTGAMLEQKDGMDLALLIINNDNLKLEFAGAFNPLFIVRKGVDEKFCDFPEKQIVRNGDYSLIELKGDRQPISIHYLESNFKTHHCQLHKSDTIYLFSDGYYDQMGGPAGKKFMSKNFKELLLKIQEQDLNAQKEILESTLEDWKGNRHQMDDVLVLGIRW